MGVIGIDIILKAKQLKEITKGVNMWKTEEDKDEALEPPNFKVKVGPFVSLRFICLV